MRSQPVNPRTTCTSTPRAFETTLRLVPLAELISQLLLLPVTAINPLLPFPGHDGGFRCSDQSACSLMGPQRLSRLTASASIAHLDCCQARIDLVGDPQRGASAEQLSSWLMHLPLLADGAALRVFSWQAIRGG